MFFDNYEWQEVGKLSESQKLGRDQNLGMWLIQGGCTTQRIYIYNIYMVTGPPIYIYIYIFMYIHMYNKPFNVSKYGEVISDPPTIRCFQTGNILFFDCCARGSLCIHPPIVYWFSRPFHILFIFYALLLHIFVW